MVFRETVWEPGGTARVHSSGDAKSTTATVDKWVSIPQATISPTFIFSTF